MWTYSPLPAAAHLTSARTDAISDLAQLGKAATLSIETVIIPDRRTAEGILIKSTSAIWTEVVGSLGRDWTLAFQIPPEKWEEILAGAFKKAAYDEVVLTPRSGDRGRDVIATKRGIGSVKIIGSMKTKKAGNVVSYDAVRSLLGVMSGEQDVSRHNNNYVRLSSPHRGRCIYRSLLADPP